MCFGPGQVFKNNKHKIQWYHTEARYELVMFIAKATFSITTEAILNELSVEEKLIHCFIYPYCFLSEL